MFTFTYQGDQFARQVEGDIAQNLKRAGFYGVSQLKKSLNRSQARHRSTGKSVSYRGLAPSSPGEYPKKVTGQLQRSIAFTSNANSLTIGTTLAKPPYPLFLQLGTRRMGARPFMTLFWQAERDNIARIVLGVTT